MRTVLTHSARAASNEDGLPSILPEAPIVPGWSQADTKPATHVLALVEPDSCSRHAEGQSSRLIYGDIIGDLC